MHRVLAYAAQEPGCFFDIYKCVLLYRPPPKCLVAVRETDDRRSL
jgi:hypothetical protein